MIMVFAFSNVQLQKFLLKVLMKVVGIILVSLLAMMMVLLIGDDDVIAPLMLSITYY